MTVAVVVIAVVAVAAVAIVVVRRRRAGDGVDSFRRQIDALSPEARRPVVDQVQSAAESSEPSPPDTEPESPSGGDPADPDFT